jgi:hypothetical protein
LHGDVETALGSTIRGHCHAFRKILYYCFFGDALGEADGAGGANEAAEVAAYAFGADDAGMTGVGIEIDGLMASIHARHIATATTHTLISVDLGIDHRFAIKMGGQNEVGQFLTHYILQTLNATSGEVSLKAQHQIVDETIAKLHHGGTNLHVATA